jgi:tetratricopeptide (TPR) repeat protein
MIDGKSACSEAEAPSGRHLWMQRGILGAVCVLVFVVYVYTAHTGAVLPSSLQAADNYYNLLVQGFRAGHLNLKTDLSSKLAQLADPYDPAAHSPYPVDDMSYYKGKLYLYFGVTPALVLFWPYVALTGRYLLQRNAVVILCFVGFLVSVGLLCALWRRYFDRVSVIAVAACAFALGLATGVPVMLSRPDVYEVAISCGYMLTMLALMAIWCALHEPRWRNRWLAAASMFYGMAVGARPSLAFGAVILLVPVLQTWRKRQKIWVSLIAATVPIAIIGLGLMLYNALRFDSPFEFGQRYQLAAYRAVEQRFFGLNYLWFNFRVYFLEPARWTAHFPFVYEIAVPPLPQGHYFVEDPYGVLTSMPVVWLALAAPLAWRGQSAEARFPLRDFLGTVALLFGICVLTICLFRGACIRYEVEFLPALLVLAVVGILGLERTLADRPFGRRLSRCVWIPLLSFSVVFNLLASVAGCAEAHNNLGGDLAHRGRMQEAIEHWERALEIRPDYVSAHVNLGNALLGSGKVKEAIAHYEQALRIKPDYAEAHNNLGVALMRMGRIEDAITQYEQALRINPHFAEAHYCLGGALEQSGRMGEAAQQYEQALQIKPDFAEAQKSLAHLRSLQ